MSEEEIPLAEEDTTEEISDNPWDFLKKLDPRTVKVSKRKPKEKKDGSMSWKKSIPKTGSIRAGGMVGGVVDAQSGVHKGTIKRPTERD